MKKDNLSGFSFLFSYLLARLQKLLHHQPLKNCTMIPTDFFGVKKPLVPATHKANFEMVAYGAMTNPADRGPRGFLWMTGAGWHFRSWGIFDIISEECQTLLFVGKYHRVRFFQKVFWRILQFLPIDQPSCSCCCWHPEICGFRAISVSDHPYLHQVLAAILAPWISAAR